jgi:hypothetical protein
VPRPRPGVRRLRRHLHPLPKGAAIISAESNARSHAEEFHWWRGCPELTDDEARLQDLLALYGATRELIREQRDLLGYYDSEADLFGDEPPFG